MSEIKVAKKNSIVYILSFEGAPIVRCTLKGKYRDKFFGRWLYVVKPLETAHGWQKGELDTCYDIVPAGCFTWRKARFRWYFKPFKIDENLPVLDDF